MNANLGWGLAVVAIAVGYAAYGWPGVVLALTVIVFWLLLQFSRAMRVMRVAGQAPVGQIDSAVMLHSKMRNGMRLMDILPLTRSLGDKVSDDPETFVWRDPSGASVRIELRAGRCTAWALQRPDVDSGADSDAVPAAQAAPSAPPAE